MKCLSYYLIFLLAVMGCARQPFLPKDSRFNVTSVLNDSVWYGTGKVLRIKEKEQQPQDVRQFNLVVLTDIDYPGMGGGPNPNTSNGCLDPECTRTQSFVIYNIPLKKGRSGIGKLNKRGKIRNEYAALSYIGNAGGLTKRYIYQAAKPGWVRITKYDKVSGIIEGRFEIVLNEDMGLYARLENGMPKTARFSNGLFRIKITDVMLK